MRGVQVELRCVTWLDSCGFHDQVAQSGAMRSTIATGELVDVGGSRFIVKLMVSAKSLLCDRTMFSQAHAFEAEPTLTGST